MKIEIFKPEDFHVLEHITPARIVCTFSINDAAEQANARFNEWLRENGKVVYGWTDSNTWSGRRTDNSHQALLIRVEPIKKCEHPDNKIRNHPTITMQSKITDMTPEQAAWSIDYRCECGAFVEPSGFKEIVKK